MKKVKLNPLILKTILLSAGLTLLPLSACKEEPVLETIAIEEQKSDEDIAFWQEAYDNYFYTYKTYITINNSVIPNYAYDDIDNAVYHSLSIKYDNLIKESKTLDEIKDYVDKGKTAFENNSNRAYQKYLKAHEYYKVHESELMAIYEQYENVNLDKLKFKEDQMYYGIIKENGYIVVISKSNITIIGEDGFGILITNNNAYYTDYQYERLGKNGYFTLSGSANNLELISKYENMDLKELSNDDLPRVKQK